MMATSQSCLITSFFKSPPKDEGTEKTLTLTKSSPPQEAAMKNELLTSQTKDPDSPCNLDSDQEDAQSDLNSLGGGDSYHGDSASDEEGFVRKPLVVNLAGLLSPGIVHTVVGDGKRQRKMCKSLKGGKSGPVNEIGTAVEMKIVSSNAGARPRVECVATKKLESSCPEITEEFPKPEPDASLKQSVLSWDSRTGGQFGKAVGLSPVEQQVEKGVRGVEPKSLETRAIVEPRGGDGPVNGSEMCDVEGEVIADGGQRRRRKKGYKREREVCENSPGCLVGSDKSRKLNLDPVVGENGEEGGEQMDVGGRGLDDSFEDFIKSVRKKRKKKHERKKKSTRRLTQLGEADNCMDFSKEELIVVTKRPRRSAALGVAERILTVQHMVENVSENAQEKDGDDASRTEPKREAADVVITDSDCGNELQNVECVHRNELNLTERNVEEERVLDDSVIIVSLTSPTKSPQKLSQICTHEEPSSNKGRGGLSSEWAKIFKQSKVDDKGTSKDECLTRSPKSSRRMRGPASTRSPKKYRSPSHSPRRCGSPRRNSLCRSPNLKNSGKQNFSPLKQSHISRRQLSFSASSTAIYDSAPLEGLVHVQQRHPSEQFWNLADSQPVRAAHTPQTSCSETAPGSGDSLGLVEVEPPCMSQVKPPLPQVCSAAERHLILSQLQKAYPKQDVERIYSRYKRIASLPEMTDLFHVANPSSTSDCTTKQPHKLLRIEKEGRGRKKEGKERKKEGRGCKKEGKGRKEEGRGRKKEGKGRKEDMGHKRKTGGHKVVRGPLMCSISICNPRNVGVKESVSGRIPVNVAAYKNTEPVTPQRKSLRLSRKKQELSEMPQCQAIKDTNKQTRSTMDADSSGRVSPTAVLQPSCKPSLFSSELWTEIYRPQTASEVIGNGAQVKQLHSWLCDWKVRCSSQRETASTEESKRNGRGTKQRGTAAMEESSSASSSKLSSIPLWVSEKDNDFISLAHLRRKHNARVPRFPDSSDTDEESSGEEEGVCPVTILCGGHGSGKTAAVYACAKELGYKVLEVNSTNVRSGHNVLATLREATLSHRVTANVKPGGDSVGTTSERHKTGNEKKTTALKSLPTGGICTFFKPVKGGVPSELNERVGVNEGGTVQPKAKRRRKSKASSAVVTGISSEGEFGSCMDSTGHAQSGASVTLATATVILLEEVDILFEEERGFWSAVYELIGTTKRPIVMTCNDSRYELECDHHKLLFNQPALPELSLHMQLLCLSHGAHVTPDAANQIAAFLKCDIRKAVTLLHFWLTLLLPSNGGSSTGSEPSATVGGELTLEDGGVGEALVGGPEEMEGRGISAAPISVEHLLGLSAVQREVLKRVFTENETAGLLGSKDCSSHVLCEVIAMVHQGGLELTHPLSDLAPLSQDGRRTSHEARTEGLSPGDTVTSDNGSLVPAPVRQGAERASTCREVILGGSESSHVLTMPWKQPHCMQRTASKYHSLDTVSNMCDTLSYMDAVAVVSCDSHVTENHHHGCFSPWWCCTTELSLCNELPLTNEQRRSVEFNVRAKAAMEALALGGRWRHGDRLGYSQDGPYGLLAAAEQRRRVAVVHSACVECAEAFGTHWEPSHVAMATDCLPALQLMCHSENLREAANTKRRFRHYLSSSIVDLQHLKSLPNIAAFPHRPPSSP